MFPLSSQSEEAKRFMLSFAQKIFTLYLQAAREQGTKEWSLQILSRFFLVVNISYLLLVSNLGNTFSFSKLITYDQELASLIPEGAAPSLPLSSETIFKEYLLPWVNEWVASFGHSSSFSGSSQHPLEPLFNLLRAYLTDATNNHSPDQRRCCLEKGPSYFLHLDLHLPCSLFPAIIKTSNCRATFNSEDGLRVGLLGLPLVLTTWWLNTSKATRSSLGFFQKELSDPSQTCSFVPEKEKGKQIEWFNDRKKYKSELNE